MARKCSKHSYRAEFAALFRRGGGAWRQTRSSAWVSSSSLSCFSADNSVQSSFPSHDSLPEPRSHLLAIFIMLWYSLGVMKKTALYGALSTALAVGLLFVAGAASAQTYSNYYQGNTNAYSYDANYATYDSCNPYLMEEYPCGGYTGGYNNNWYDPYAYNYNWNWGGGYFDYCSWYPWYQGCNTNQNQGTLSISGVSGPTSIAVGQQGTWSITTNAPANTYVSVSVRWGDENTYPYAAANASMQVYQQNTFTHTYQQAGTYTITFTVTDSYGRTQTATATVQVTGGGSQSGALSPSPTYGAAPLSVMFRSTLYDPQSYYVIFVDGEYGFYQICAESYPYQCSLSHVYQRAGTFTANLIQSYTGATVASVTVTVSGGIQQGDSLSASPRSGNAPLFVSFTATVRNTGTYFIDFGDGSDQALNQCAFSNPMQCSTSHTYSRAGTFTAKLMRSQDCPYPMLCPATLETVDTVRITVEPRRFN